MVGVRNSSQTGTSYNNSHHVLLNLYIHVETGPLGMQGQEGVRVLAWKALVNSDVVVEHDVICVWAIAPKDS
jgi:hypothetical protein